MNKCRLSFIVPVFNGANYIQKCLDSLLSQDIPISDYEIILVNDCSTDNSKQVIANYKREYANIVYIEHSKILG
jgi:glycosyltransferase involved in cell wall biosynthesis